MVVGEKEDRVAPTPPPKKKKKKKKNLNKLIKINK